MDPFADPDMMAKRSLGAITATSHPFLERELAAASDEIRARCGWHIAGVMSLTYRRRSRFAEDVWIPAMRIEAVTSATIDGVTWTDVEEFDENTGWTNLRGRKVEVQYRAGFQDAPESIVALTLQIAARSLGAPLGIVREQTLGASVTHSTTAAGVAGGVVVLPHELSTLVPYTIGKLP